MKKRLVVLLLTAPFIVGSCGGSTSRAPLATGTPELATSSSTKVTKDHDYQGTLGRILVIGVLAEPELKRIFEEALVARFQNAGREAVAAHAVLPGDQQLTREMIRTQIADTQIDGVLVARLVGAGMVTTAPLPADGPTEPSARRPDVDAPDSDLYGHYASVYQAVHTPGYAADTPEVEVSVKLFEVENETSVWQMSRTIENPHGRSQIFDALGDAIVESLLNEGLI